MNKETEKIKIQDLSSFLSKNKPYIVEIDINTDKVYWELGMKTRYMGKDVEILSCLKHIDYSIILREHPTHFETESRSIQTLLIRDL